MTVRTGPQFQIGMVSFEGAIQLALDVLHGEVGLQEGAFYRPEGIEAARTRLQARYRREGFSTASIEAREETRPSEPVVDVVFSSNKVRARSSRRSRYRVCDRWQRMSREACHARRNRSTA